MKKFLLFMVSVLTFGLISCGGEDVIDSTDPDSTELSASVIFEQADAFDYAFSINGTPVNVTIDNTSATTIFFKYTDAVGRLGQKVEVTVTPKASIDYDSFPTEVTGSVIVAYTTCQKGKKAVCSNAESIPVKKFSTYEAEGKTKKDYVNDVAAAIAKKLSYTFPTGE